jgi:hypothetical protein
MRKPSSATAHKQNALALVPMMMIAAYLITATGCGHSGSSSASASGETPPHAAVVQVRRAPLSNTLSIAGEFTPYQEV